MRFSLALHAAMVPLRVSFGDRPCSRLTAVRGRSGLRHDLSDAIAIHLGGSISDTALDGVFHRLEFWPGLRALSPCARAAIPNTGISLRKAFCGTHQETSHRIATQALTLSYKHPYSTARPSRRPGARPYCEPPSPNAGLPRGRLNGGRCAPSCAAAPPLEEQAVRERRGAIEDTPRDGTPISDTTGPARQHPEASRQDGRDFMVRGRHHRHFGRHPLDEVVGYPGRCASRSPFYRESLATDGLSTSRVLAYGEPKNFNLGHLLRGCSVGADPAGARDSCSHAPLAHLHGAVVDEFGAPTGCSPSRTGEDHRC